MSLNLSILTLASFIAVYLCVVFKFSNLIVSKIGQQGPLFLVLGPPSFCYAGLAWMLSLSAPLNDEHNPLILGTGGVYGLEPDSFPSAVLGVAIGAFISTLPLFFFKSDMSKRQAGFKAVVRNIGAMRYLLIAWSLLLFACYFTSVGWDRWWSSPLDRFELDPMGASKSQFLDPRLLWGLLLMTGMLGATLALTPNSRMVALATCILTSIPFAAFASRGMIAIMGAYFACDLVGRKGFWQWTLRGVIYLYAVRLLLIAPLMMRGAGGTGVVHLAMAFRTAILDPVSVSDSTITLLQNLGQGFGLLTDVLQGKHEGLLLHEATPIGYWLRSFSPLPSIIDGYGTNFVDFAPRLNAFTPYGGMCEILDRGVWWAVVVYFGISATAMLAIKRIARVKFAADAAGFVIILLFVLGYWQLMQYPVRTGFRYFWAAIFCTLVFVMGERWGRTGKFDWLQRRIARVAAINNLEVLPIENGGKRDRSTRVKNSN